MHNGPMEEFESTSPPVPGARPNPFIDQIVVILTIILLGVMTFIGLYFG